MQPFLVFSCKISSIDFIWIEILWMYQWMSFHKESFKAKIASALWWDTKLLSYTGCCSGQETAFCYCFTWPCWLKRLSITCLQSRHAAHWPYFRQQVRLNAMCPIFQTQRGPSPHAPRPRGPSWVSQPGIASPFLCPATPDSVSHSFSEPHLHHQCLHSPIGRVLCSYLWCLPARLLLQSQHGWSVETSFACHCQVHCGSRWHRAGSGRELLVSGAGGLGDVRPVRDPPRTWGNTIAALIHTTKIHFIP